MIHLRRVPIGVCKGRDSYTAELYNERKRMMEQKLSGIVKTTEHIADFSGNVECKRCLAWLKSNRKRRLQMEHTEHLPFNLFMQRMQEL